MCNLTVQEIGHYTLLLANLWVHGGSLHIKVNNVRRLIRIKSEKHLRFFLDKLENIFIVNGDIITCPMLNDQMQKQANYRLKASEYGRKGAKKRWGTPSKNNSFPYSKLQAPNSIIYHNNSFNHFSEGNTDGHSASSTNTTDPRDVSDLARDFNGHAPHRESGNLAGTAKPRAADVTHDRVPCSREREHVVSDILPEFSPDRGQSASGGRVTSERPTPPGYSGQRKEEILWLGPEEDDPERHLYPTPPPSAW